jgi:dCMP deaminase
MNAILNAVRLGQTTLGMHMVVTCEPCLMCAKMIHHAGIASILCISARYATLEGVSYLETHLGDQHVYFLREVGGS